MSLARLRFEVAASRGRRHREPDHPYRDAFERDRDRIIHSRAFRRLEAKTQVFTQPYSDHFRNRLTHTIEVAQIARTAARALELNENLVEALALGHDIGHPPFGHAGERILDEEMRRHGDRFDHNLHALRVVEFFAQRYAAFPGLNLTFETREGLAKHSRDYEPGESEIVDEYLPEARPPLEAQLIDVADEIAYNTADLDDAVEARLLEPDSAGDEVALFGRALLEAGRENPAASWRLVFNEALRRLVDQLVTALIEGTRAAAEEAGVGSVDDVRRFDGRLARMTPEAAEASRELKRLLSRKVYRSAGLEREALHAAERLRDLFRAFMKMPSAMPRIYRERVEKEPAHRVVCDYIAGMTDPYLMRRHQEILGGPEPTR